MSNFPDNVFPGRYLEFRYWTFGHRSEEAEAAPAGPNR
jgi:hypothetical protein